MCVLIPSGHVSETGTLVFSGDKVAMPLGIGRFAWFYVPSKVFQWNLWFSSEACGLGALQMPHTWIWIFQCHWSYLQHCYFHVCILTSVWSASWYWSPDELWWVSSTTVDFLFFPKENWKQISKKIILRSTIGFYKGSFLEYQLQRDQGILTSKDLAVICLLLPKLGKIPNSRRYRLSILLTWSSVTFSRLSKDQEMQITIFPFKRNCHFTACFPTGKKIVRFWIPVVAISMHSVHIQLLYRYRYNMYMYIVLSGEEL